MKRGVVRTIASSLLCLGLVVAVGRAWQHNRAGLALRDRLVNGAAAPLDAARVRALADAGGDLAIRILAETGDEDGAVRRFLQSRNDAPITRRYHAYAAAIRLERWDLLAPHLMAMPGPELASRPGTTLGRESPGAVLQRAAEMAADAGDEALAASFAARARELTGANQIAGDPSNAFARARRGAAISAVAEFHRVLLDDATMAADPSVEDAYRRAFAHLPPGDASDPWQRHAVSNGAFEWWVSERGLVPGWKPARADAAYRVQRGAGTFLRVCADPGDGVSWFENLGFRGSPGMRYRLRGRARATDAVPGVAYIGVHFVDAAGALTRGAYALAGQAGREWALYESAWTMPIDASRAVLVIGLRAGSARACVTFDDLEAVALGPAAPASP